MFFVVSFIPMLLQCAYSLLTVLVLFHLRHTCAFLLLFFCCLENEEEKNGFPKPKNTLLYVRLKSAQLSSVWFMLLWNIIHFMKPVICCYPLFIVMLFKISRQKRTIFRFFFLNCVFFFLLTRKLMEWIYAWHRQVNSRSTQSDLIRIKYSKPTIKIDEYLPFILKSSISVKRRKKQKEHIKKTA